MKVKLHIHPIKLGRMPICFKTIMKPYVNKTYDLCLAHSYKGGSSVVMVYLCVGLVLAVSRKNRRKKLAVPIELEQI